MAVWSCWVFTTIVIWFAVFLTCFMPIKKESSGLSSVNDVQQQTEDFVHGAVPLRRQFNKTVIVLVDALRADFILGSDTPMLMTKELISQNLAFVAKAHTPTVTLPRVKALVTGSVPGFVDVVLNFGSAKYEGDSILAQMSQAKQRVVFYGDNTWIKLFSDHFTRYEGTTSFFVTDYTEVDNNVTRHLPSEFAQGDFDLLILHYLGLDHIGHMAGPSSPLVPPKLREMDEIINMIYQSLAKLQDEGLPNLLIVCGDHGMSDQGSHGGASYSETRVPLVFLSTKGLHHSGDGTKSEVDQIDLVPTLSELLGLPIPQNNLGRLLLEVFEESSPEEQLASLLRNTIQLLNLLKANQQEADTEVTALFLTTCKLHAELLSINSSERSDAMVHRVLTQYNEVITMATSNITKNLTTYDMPALITCIICLWAAVFLLVLSRHSPLPWMVLIHVTSTMYLLHHLTRSQSVWHFLSPGYFTSVSALLVVVLTTAFRNRESFRGLFQWIGTVCVDDPGSRCVALLIVGTFLHTLSLLSSSFVEEEHQTWYFLSTSIHSIHFISQLSTTHPLPLCENTHRHLNSSKNHLENGTTFYIDPMNLFTYKTRKMALEVFVLLLTARLSRSLNQTGNKWLHLPDIEDWLILEDNKCSLSVLVAISLFLTLVIISQQLSWLQTAITATGLFCVFWFRASTGALSLPVIPVMDRGILPARLSFVCLVILLISQFTPVSFSRTGFTNVCLTAWTLLHVLLMKSHNIILVALMTVQQYVLSQSKLVLSPSAAVVYYMWMGRSAFFSQGNSNSIATVDVGAGYVGQRDYNAVPVAILLALATYAGPIYWFLAFLTKLNSLRPSKRDLHNIFITMAMAIALPVMMYAGFVVMERYHLFVWTVFLPKLLYLGMDLVIYSILSITLVVMYHLKT
ncbi:GPI ethanolamine phosphate transferase 2-like isoform X2 [Ostrea edulis]|nr:GPI ethanolamine phosphate transferase 2-like isoform X2 [Ostrea edulis]XP_056020022.1 GPI ethanolamine phosphate transferase 2-like isoform X2 [Ostrea edulis]XP_056020023.1 GPI ethanolamine phosphate transferase 2-like isoform X2 [Ostrea edulis]